MATKVKAKKSPKKSTPARPRRGRATSSRISSKNQITIPVEVLREMSLKPGDQVEFHINKENRLVITPVDSDWLQTLDEVLGSMTGMWDGFDVRKEREEWDSKYS
ncbi:MAG: AbrB/MazE/SpoVT family DNA-binding domain-containing protein [Actinobacteria bacterium]|jgi:AbrB family looped-hinge helix DNA binding protein|nr:AbrB/MazE/SpoVT family DNA-binding domain-containing protein [Actinomycetota bacterium]